MICEVVLRVFFNGGAVGTWKKEMEAREIHINKLSRIYIV